MESFLETSANWIWKS